MDNSNEIQIKEAFQKIKHDIYSLYAEISSLKRDLYKINKDMIKISEILIQLSKITQNSSKKQQKIATSESLPYPAIRQINPTVKAQNPANPTDIPTHFSEVDKGKQDFSTGNEGVPTDRQTDRQTDNNEQNKHLFTKKFIKKQFTFKNPIEDAAKALDSLDSLKKEIRLKFKQLTDQEVLIFSTLYQIEEEQGPVNYKTLSVKLNLTESSIRDYIGRLLQKGIPIEKKRLNNKKILLSVSQNLKKIASLQTILSLRDL